MNSTRSIPFFAAFVAISFSALAAEPVITKGNKKLPLPGEFFVMGMNHRPAAQRRPFQVVPGSAIWPAEAA